MKNLCLVMIVLSIYSASCSKSSSIKESESPSSETSALTDKNKEYHNLLIGNWKLIKQVSDMGAVSWTAAYRRKLTFDSSFF